MNDELIKGFSISWSVKSPILRYQFSDKVILEWGGKKAFSFLSCCSSAIALFYLLFQKGESLTVAHGGSLFFLLLAEITD